MSHAEHEWAREQLAAHLAGGLPADERARFEDHAAGCAECIAELDAQRRFDRRMDDLFSPVRPPSGLEDRLIRALREQPVRRPISLFGRLALGAAAVVMLGVAGFVVMEVEGEPLAIEKARLVAAAPAPRFDEGELDRDQAAAVVNRVSQEGLDAEVRELTVVDDLKRSKDDAVTYSYRTAGPAEGKSLGGERAGAKNEYFRPGSAVPAAPPAAKPEPVAATAVTRLQQEARKSPETQEPAVPSNRKIIRNGEMEFEIEAFDSTVARITTIASEEGGFVSTVNSEKLPNGKVRGTIVLRCPPDRLDTLILKLRGLGELKSQRITSQDVSKTYFDMESRLRAARAMEERLLAMIKEGKGAIKDLLLAEKELGEWRTKIEGLEGEMRYYNNLISLSTLNLTLYEKEIRAPFGATETERVSAGLETEDVEKAHKEVLAAVAEAKGRVTRSELKQLDAGQFNATVHFEVEPAAAGPLRDRLKQIGSLVRLDINRIQETEGGQGKIQDLKIKQKDTQFFLSIYNLTNVSPRETVHLAIACVDTEKSYKAILQRVEKAGGRVRSSNLNRQKSDQTSGTIDFEIKSAEADAVLLDVRAAGEVMSLQATENPDAANVTASKRGFRVTLASLGAVQPRETVQIQLAAKDVSAAYQALLEAVRKAEGRVLQAQLNEADRRRVTATLHFDLRRDHEKAIADAMAAAGEVYTRTSARRQDAGDVVDSKVGLHLTLISAANIPPRETVTLNVNVGNVEKSLELLRAILSESGARVVDSHHDHSGGRSVSRIVVDLPLKDAWRAADRVKGLGDRVSETSKPNPSVPDTALSVARLDVTLSNDPVVSPESGPLASIRKGLSVSLTALSWSLTLVIVGLCLVLPIGGVIWAGVKVTRKLRKPVAA